jgi:histidine phosphotransferase ChpT
MQLILIIFFVSENLALVQLMAAKICHDLATPLGALSLSFEMTEDILKRHLDSSTFEILNKSLNGAKNKLNIYRAILSAGETTPNLSDTANLGREYAKEHNVRLQFPPMLEIDPGPICRIFLGIMYISIDSLIRGGSISIHSGDNVTIEVNGPTVQFKPGYEDVILGNTSFEDINGRTILPYYLLLLAKEKGRLISLENKTENSFKIIF